MPLLQVAYRCPVGRAPLHLTPPGLHPRDNYPEFLGGNIVFTPEQFARVNGFHVRCFVQMLCWTSRRCIRNMACLNFQHAPFGAHLTSSDGLTRNLLCSAACILGLGQRG